MFKVLIMNNGKAQLEKRLSIAVHQTYYMIFKKIFD